MRGVLMMDESVVLTDHRPSGGFTQNDDWNFGKNIPILAIITPQSPNIGAEVPELKITLMQDKIHSNGK